MIGMQQPPEGKACKKCLADLPLESFQLGTGKFGRQPSCRACRVAESRARYMAKRTEIIAKVNAYRISMGDNYNQHKREIRAQRIARDPLNLSKERAGKARWRAEHPTENAEYQKRYREANRDSIRQKTRARQASLTDDVVVSCLFAGVPVPARDLIPPSLIEAKREQLRLRREIYKENKK